MRWRWLRGFARTSSVPALPSGLVYRYRGDDGLKGEEGTFLLCTFWLAETWACAGHPAHAREVFERAAAYRNDVDLLAEQVDSDSAFLGSR